MTIKNIAQLVKKHPHVYHWLKRNNRELLHKLLSPSGKKYTKEECLVSALPYRTRTQWKKSCPSVYNAAIKNGWVDECCNHMTVLIRKITKQECIKSALPYDSKKKWNEECPKEYNKAWRRGWLGECCAHMKPNHITWDIEAIWIEARKYDTRSKFVKSSPVAYHAARKLGMLDDVCGHMDNVKLPNGHWKIKENVTESARPYNKVYKWQAACSGAYQSALENGWIKEATAHMIPSKNSTTTTKCTETGEVFISQAEAARKMSLDSKLINSVLKGKQKSTGGYSFTYVKESDNTEE
jgi:hypothetical protein